MNRIKTPSKNARESNIDPELFGLWKSLQKKGDIKELCEKLNVSEPVIGRALKYGYVSKYELVVDISKFFNDRKGEQDQMTQSLAKAPA